MVFFEKVIDGHRLLMLDVIRAYALERLVADAPAASVLRDP